MAPHPVALVADVQDQIGEAPAWDGANQRLLWIDHVSGIIHQLRSRKGGGWQETEVRHLHQPLAAALPCANGGLVVVGGTKVFLMDASGSLMLFTQVDADPERIRLNDAKCDMRGRLWASAIDMGSASNTGLRRCGALYRIDPDGVTHALPVESSLANGLDWSPDSTQFYLADSLDRSIDVFDFDLQRGLVANRRPLIRFEPGGGLPNGLAVDRNGDLWVAVTAGAEVRRYRPDGDLVESVEVPVALVTSCAFGGPEGKDLFVTTRRGRLSSFAGAAGVPEERMTSEGPGAGGVFVCRPGPAGAPATPFAR